MRGLLGIAALAALVGCGSDTGTATVEGSAGGVDFADTSYVYFGEPFIVVSMIEVACEDLSYMRRNYEDGVAPTEDDTALLQFSFMDADAVSTGIAPIDITASVSASVVRVQGGALYESVASGGILTVDEVVDDATATGSFEEVTFDDGTLNGSFEAVWCRNLKAQ